MSVARLMTTTTHTKNTSPRQQLQSRFSVKSRRKHLAHACAFLSRALPAYFCQRSTASCPVLVCLLQPRPEQRLLVLALTSVQAIDPYFQSLDLCDKQCSYSSAATETERILITKSMASHNSHPTPVSATWAIFPSSVSFLTRTFLFRRHGRFRRLQKLLLRA